MSDIDESGRCHECWKALDWCTCAEDRMAKRIDAAARWQCETCDALYKSVEEFMAHECPVVSGSGCALTESAIAAQLRPIREAHERWRTESGLQALLSCEKAGLIPSDDPTLRRLLAESAAQTIEIKAQEAKLREAASQLQRPAELSAFQEMMREKVGQAAREQQMLELATGLKHELVPHPTQEHSLVWRPTGEPVAGPPESLTRTDAWGIGAIEREVDRLLTKAPDVSPEDSAQPVSRDYKFPVIPAIAGWQGDVCRKCWTATQWCECKPADVSPDATSAERKPDPVDISSVYSCQTPKHGPTRAVLLTNIQATAPDVSADATAAVRRWRDAGGDDE